MRYLIVSDLHSNREAVEAVAADAEGRYDAVLCLGDIVGYGADPVAAIEWVRNNVQSVVRGNHDKAAVGLEDLEWFNPAARMSAFWTQAQLSRADQEWIRALPQGPLEVEDFEIMHGSPLDEDEYLVGIREVMEVADYVERSVSFFGHTHLQGGFQLHRNGVIRMPRPNPFQEEVTVELEPDSRYLLNPGSVGQPRDGDARAAYAIYDRTGRFVTYRRVLYDIRRAQERIVSAGLPDVLAYRLSNGT